jgi:hypothetical protein
MTGGMRGDDRGSMTVRCHFSGVHCKMIGEASQRRDNRHMKTRLLLAVWLASGFTGLSDQPEVPDQPRYTAAGELVRPANYREWIYLTSGLGMTYGVVQEGASAPAAPRFDNVFVTPAAYRSFLRTGAWPDKTIFILEVRSSTTKGSINNGGHYQEGVVGVEAHVKDTSRFPGQWAFFNLGPSAASGKQLPADSSCQTCHARHGAVDQTFVQFYPTLIPIAREKGTFSQRDER